ncbi:hypothetical protein IBT47_24845 [Erwinia sp. S43]|uniref:LPD29 domain-containing protein n=1 Tax=Erwinia sp. S43 TaxID=2769339 RepID=UPI00190C943F|nr:LPD29 domain-containing protein [Erwinia sp. S43]MBK0035512.1 hypothetical protein [Erwinia sp. S43]
MKNTQQKPLVVGQVVSTNLYNKGRGAVFAIDGEQKPETVVSVKGIMTRGGNAKFDIAFFNGSISRSLPESILHGVQWSVTDEVISGDELDNLVSHCLQVEDNKRKQIDRAKVIFENLCIQLKTDKRYSHLTQEQSGANQVTKNIRKELKSQFPGVKFSVRKNHYDSITVSWTDGPTEENVKSVTEKYRDSFFDSSQDMSVSCRSAFNVVYGGVGYISLKREFTDAILDKALSGIHKKYGTEFEGVKIDKKNYKSGALYRTGQALFWHSQGFDGEIRRVMKVTE